MEHEQYRDFHIYLFFILGVLSILTITSMGMTLFVMSLIGLF